MTASIDFYTHRDKDSNEAIDYKAHAHIHLFVEHKRESSHESTSSSETTARIMPLNQHRPNQDTDRCLRLQTNAS